jgi:flagellar hook-associated protein 1 FlgK
MSGYVNVNVYESPTGMYSLVSDGVTLVNGVNKLTLAMSDPYVNEEYGVNDYSVILKESGIAYMPSNGKLKAQMDQIVEDKNYIDYLADMSAFMLTTFNHQHQQGVGIDTASTTVDYTASDGSTGTLTVQGSVGQNFYGDRSTIYSWDDATRSVIATAYSGGITSELKVTASMDPSGVTTYKTSANAKGLGTASSPLTMKGINIIKELEVNALLTATDGQNLVAARSWGTTSGTDSSPAAVRTPEVNGTGDGTNAVDMSILFNANQENTSIESDTSTDKRSIGRISLEAYYNQRMTALGSDAETMDSKVISQDEVMTQIEEWRKSVSGVNWNEELTNMIMFQQGYSACSRCLTTMDEMLDKLINSTGTVGR